MKIRIEKDIVQFTPEHAAEAAELEALWVKLGNCVGNTKSLQPIGTYVPSENKTAAFHIEGLNEQEFEKSAEISSLLFQKPVKSPARNAAPRAVASVSSNLSTGMPERSA